MLLLLLPPLLLRREGERERPHARTHTLSHHDTKLALASGTTHRGQAKAPTPSEFPPPWFSVACPPPPFPLYAAPGPNGADPTGQLLAYANGSSDGFSWTRSANSMRPSRWARPSGNFGQLAAILPL
jgi:hypothetical protein